MAESELKRSLDDILGDIEKLLDERETKTAKRVVALPERAYEDPVLQRGLRWFKTAPLALREALQKDDEMASLKAWRREAREVANLAETEESLREYPVEAALCLLDTRYGQQPQAKGACRMAGFEALKQLLEQEVIPKLEESKRKDMLRASLPFAGIDLLRSTPFALLTDRDTFATKSLDLLPDTFFETKVPKDIRFLVCSHSEKRFRKTIFKILDNWRAKVSPKLKVALNSEDFPSSQARTTLPEANLASLVEMASYDDHKLLERVVQVVSELVFLPQKKTNFWPTLMVDLVLSINVKSSSAAARERMVALRRVATASDAILVAGRHDEASFTKLRLAISKGDQSLNARFTTEPRAAPSLKKRPLQTNSFEEKLDEAWDLLKKADPSNTFASPVTDLAAPGYSKKIKEPMDLGTMRSKIGRSYATVDDFQADLRRIVDNCKKFNGPYSPYTAQAQKLWKAWLHIKDTLNFFDEKEKTTALAPTTSSTTTSTTSAAPMRQKRSRAQTDFDLFRIVSRVVVMEPFAETLCAKNLVEEVEAAVAQRQLPRDRKRCRDLAHYLALASAARTGDATSAADHIAVDLANLGLAVAEERRAARREKNKRKNRQDDTTLIPNVLAAALATSTAAAPNDSTTDAKQHHHHLQENNPETTTRPRPLRDYFQQADGFLTKRLLALDAHTRFFSNNDSF